MLYAPMWRVVVVVVEQADSMAPVERRKCQVPVRACACALYMGQLLITTPLRAAVVCAHPSCICQSPTTLSRCHSTPPCEHNGRTFGVSSRNNSISPAAISIPPFSLYGHSVRHCAVSPRITYSTGTDYIYACTALSPPLLFTTIRPSCR